MMESSIRVLGETVVYENPVPHLRSRHGYFPGIAELPSGDLLALFCVGEAFEAVDLTTCISRSRDQGRTWEFEGPLCDKSAARTPTTDTMKPALLRDGTLIALKFGQPSLLRLRDGRILAVHWRVEDVQGRIIAHRLSLGEGL